ncbi:MAG: carboxyl transferase domain-containing protein, partial [Gemmataceae bacterium]
VTMSGVVPQVAAMMGPGYAGTAYIPGLADFVPMVKGTSAMALAGPALVKAAVGEDVTEDQLGARVALGVEELSAVVHDGHFPLPARASVTSVA